VGTFACPGIDTQQDSAHTGQCRAAAPTTYRQRPALTEKKEKCFFFLNDLMNIIVHKTLLKTLQKHCQTVFSRFLSMTIFIPAEKKTGTIRKTWPESWMSVLHLVHRMRQSK
jgi:hypothetical protein